MTVLELINELLKAEDKTMEVGVIWERISCGVVVNVLQGKHRIILETEIPDPK